MKTKGQTTPSLLLIAGILLFGGLMQTRADTVATTTVYTGAIAGDYLGTVTLSAAIFDASSGLPTGAGTGVHFSLRQPGVGQPELQGCSGTVDAAGHASCSLQIQQPAGSYTIIATELGDGTYMPSTISAPFTVPASPTSLAYTGPSLIEHGLPVTVSALFTDNFTGMPISGQVIVFTLGMQSCSGTTDGNGVASCTINNVSQPLGPASIQVSFAGNGDYPANSTTSSVVVFSRYTAQIQQPINPDGTSVFNVRRGVVPVKFTLTQNGVATCALPPATIAVTRTAGGTTGAVDEAVYTGPADSGSNFRIDSCQYVFNLSASALGVGTYRIDILINGQLVGSASFRLK